MISVERYLPSMFHRRLVLLLLLGAIALMLLFAQLFRLTALQGRSLRAEADQRLVRHQWLPTSRGSILDRKGRILAQDRPSYNIALQYRVITGEWAGDTALQLAKRTLGHPWQDLSPEQREERVAMFLPACKAHLERAWDLLAQQAGVSREDLDAKRDAVIRDIETKFATIADLRRAQLEQEYKDRGETISPKQQNAINARARRPVAEQQAPHVLIRKVPDEAAFACMVIAADEVDLAVEGLDTMSGAANARVERIPGVSVVDSGDREYPIESADVDIDLATLPGPLKADRTQTIRVDGLACHLLGKVRDKVYADDAPARDAFLASNPSLQAAAFSSVGKVRVDRGGYRDGDRVGDTGLERSQEHALRGLRGLRTTQLDTGAVTPIPSQPGRDARLTLDIQLQARVQAVMSPALGLAVVQPWHHTPRVTADGTPIPGAPAEGSPLFGSAVVLDIDTAEILAMVSTPTFTRRQLREEPESIFADTPELRLSTPTLNRAIAKAYQPGSIVKAFLLAEAISRGNLPIAQRLPCTGHLLPDRPTMYRCWIYKQQNATHNDVYGHDLDGAEAVAGSCNIFFFTLGRRLGPESIVRAYRDFGVCEPLRLGAGIEYQGELGPPRKDPNDPARTILGDGSNVSIGDAIQMGIGQGPVAWTPVHAADAYAALARGGIFVKSRLLLDEPASPPRDLALDPDSINLALKGLSLSVNDPKGTGNHIKFDGIDEPIFNAPGVKVWGKTGTAAASPVVGDPDGEGPDPKQVLRSGDHSWFVIMVGRDRPRYVISVVIDFGGSGGKVSGPIANQIVHALLAEGYLEHKEPTP